MSSQIFAKFQYQDKIKKVAISPSDLTWNNISNIISRSFSISPSRIKLTYKDPEGDEITACCDQDLIEAQRASPKQQPLRFFIYKATLNHQKSMPINHSASKHSHSSHEDTIALNSSAKSQQKSKSLTAIKDPSSEKKESLIISQDSDEPVISLPQHLKLSSDDMKSLLKTLFQTTEAKAFMQTIKLNNNLARDSTNIIPELDLDSKEFQQLFCESLTIALNDEPVKEQRLPFIEEIQPAEIDLKSTIMSRGSYEEEEEQKEVRAKVNNHKLDFEKSLLDSTLKETIYEKSQNNNNMLRRTLDKNQLSMRNKSLSSSICCKDLTSSYGVKLALQYENGRMRLLSIPSGEYTIIDSIGASKGDNSNAASHIKKSSTVDVLPRLT